VPVDDGLRASVLEEVERAAGGGSAMRPDELAELGT